ncbi:MAG: alpha/beta hydrolase [Ilumatobacteraceae bacterium]
MASQEAQAINEIIKAYRDSVVPDGPPPTVEQQRAGADASMEAVGTMPDGIDVQDANANGVSGLWITPRGATTDRVVLYLHGGGYVVQSARTHVKLAAHIAVQSNCRVLSIDYRLAPEHPHPAAVTDALAAYRHLLDAGFAPERIAISGDSAGGGLTVATLVAARDAALPQPCAGIPLSPWVDLEGVGESMDSNAGNDFMVGRGALATMAELFIGNGSKRDPLAAPLYAELHDIAPLYIQVGGHETLLDDSTRLAARAARAGVEVRLDVFPEMQHVFQAFVGQMPEATEAICRIGAYLTNRWS